MDYLPMIAQLRATQATLEAAKAQIEAQIIRLLAEGEPLDESSSDAPSPCPTCAGERTRVTTLSGPASLVCNGCGTIDTEEKAA